MRRLTAILSFVAAFLVVADVFAQAKPSFAGEWKIATNQADDGGGRGGGPGLDLVITQDATSMTVEYVRGPAPASAKLTYKLDGSVSRNTIYGSGRSGASTELVSKAVWAGSAIVVTTTTGSGEEKRTFSIDAGYLVIETAAAAAKGGVQTTSKVVYQRYERGFGG
jgi:hypothetical protein